MPSEKRSDEWPERHAEVEEKWKNVEEKVKAGEVFAYTRGFVGLKVWTQCGYCKEFGDSDLPLCPCWNCPLNQRLVKYEGVLLTVCDSLLNAQSIVPTFVTKMRERHPDKEKCLKLVKIIRDEIAKDKPGTTGQKQGENLNAGW